MLLAALTGGIGSGKSTVAQGLGQRGAVVVDADAIGRQILEPGGLAYQSVIDHFGPGVVHADASINRFLSGEGEELHDMALKVQEASLSFDLFLQVRSKIISAYQSVMSMQV